MERQRPQAGSDVSDEVDQAWREHRRRLLNIGFRMLGNLGGAEDAVQEAFARLVRADISEIDDVEGWLVVVVSRICLDRLRAERRHPTSPDALLGDRAAGSAFDPADRVTLDDNVRIGLHLVLERLSPAERTAFVLHDVFQYSFDSIAEIVGRTPAACRQLASRARRTITTDGGRSRFQVESAEQRRVSEQFMAACSTGDLDGLLEILDPDVAGEADVGGRIGVVITTGREAVAAAALRYIGPTTSTTLLSFPAGDEVGIVALRAGRVAALLLITVREGVVEHIEGLVDPVKLVPIGEALGSRRTRPDP